MKKLSTMMLLGLICTAPLSTFAADSSMSFFITSENPGKGGDLGGLEGADAHCQTLAKAAGAGDKKWAAYLSTEADDKRGISARDRIGTGPWHNAKGVLIAKNLTELHVYNTTITEETALNEKGEMINSRAVKPTEHDILTGSTEGGIGYRPDDADHTCSNWTSNSSEGSAQVGHSDRNGGGNVSWVSSHGSRGCGVEDFPKSGGAGLFYCFATNK